LKIKPLQLAGIMLFLTAAGLFITAFFAKKTGNENLLLVIPAEFRSPGIAVNRIEDFIEYEFLVTYEILSSQRINLPHIDYPVTVIETNSCYSQVFRFVIPEGSFFSPQAWSGRQRHAVLNETAAHNIFGSSRITGNQFRMQNETWIVTGVINDGDEENNRVYIPSSIKNSQAVNFLALMAPSAGYDETYLINSFKTIGIHENNFIFINLGTHINLLFERGLIILFFLSGFVFIYFLINILGSFKKSIAVFRNELNKHYLYEIFRKNPKIVFKTIWLALLVILCPVLSAFLFLRAASVILPWQDIKPLISGKDIFYPHINKLYNYEIISRFIFIFSIIMLALFVIILITRISKKKP